MLKANHTATDAKQRPGFQSTQEKGAQLPCPPRSDLITWELSGGRVPNASF
jgi:hypothetical protein